MIRYFLQDPPGGALPAFIEPERIDAVRRFHGSVPGYAPTPLLSLESFARKLGLGGVYVKDESYRFGLNAFKALGGIHAAAAAAAKQAGLAGELSMERLLDPAVADRIRDMTFVTATDGNHGRGVAWAARMLGCGAVVYMPKGSSIHRFEAIREFGAHVEILDMNYDDAVRYAYAQAEENGWVPIQDTAWEGYEDIPNAITLGYMTMVDEALQQIEEQGLPGPTHVLVQAGVGSMAGGVLGYLVSRFGPACPKTVVMEASAAACIYESMRIGDGKPHAVTGDLDTIMAGLACGEANAVTFGILRDHAAAFLSCDDDVARLGMRLLANPAGQGAPIVSGESGAVGAGVLELVMRDARYGDIREKLGLNSDSRVLFFSTEGATDPENYERIIREGK